MKSTAVGLIALLLAPAARAQGSFPFCQILDRVENPAWEAHGGYMQEADAKGTASGGFGAVHAFGGGGLAFFRTDAGDFDLTGFFDHRYITGDDDLGLPDQLLAAGLKGSYAWRDELGHAARVTFTPSLRSDLENADGDDLYYPFTIELIRSFDPSLSGLIGLAAFPGFDRVLDPRVGLRWSPTEALRVDVMYPESRIVIEPSEAWLLEAGIVIDATSEWRIDDEAESVMLRETRFYAGLEHALGSRLRMQYRIGEALDRSIDFDKVRGKTDMDNAWFFSVGVGGEL